MAGSSSCFNSVVPAPLADLDITRYPSATGTNGYVTEVGLNTTGEALDWLARLFYDRKPRRDDFARLAHFGPRIAEVQLQPSDGLADHHWPFTPERNATGLVDPARRSTPWPAPARPTCC